MTSTAVLAKGPDEPICTMCAQALGGQVRHDQTFAVVIGTCCVCSHERRCVAIRDHTWPVTPDTVHGKRPLHEQIDDYSELETWLRRPWIDRAPD